MSHYEPQGREISNPTRYGEGGMLRAQERLHLHASRGPCGCIAECIVADGGVARCTS
jgi:hypothetical protein